MVATYATVFHGGIVRRPAGLHAEITLTTALLVAAALLFGGVLLLRVTEQELMSQRVRAVETSLRMLVSWLSFSGEQPESQFPALINTLGEDLLSWQFYDGTGKIIAASQVADHNFLMPPLAQQARFVEGPIWQVERPQIWIPGIASDPGYIDAAIALKPRIRDDRIVWVRFSLQPVQQQMFRSYRLLFVYVLLYGGVLTVFGVVALRRNVVQPVRQLQQVIGQVAAGDLQAEAQGGGPREINELASSFNAMTKALLTGREALLRSERMASVGHLAAGMAHEIGNPLAAVIGYLEVLKTELPEGRERAIVNHSLNETARIDRLVRDLLDYASPDSELPSAVDLVPILRDSVEMLGRQAAFSDCPLRLDCPAELPRVHINPHKLQQVLINLVGNARDASSAGQDVAVVAASDGETVMVQIRDQGTGIAESELPHIFDPFFTAKKIGQGRGLGLTVCHRIVSEAGGSIRVESELGVGSTFIVVLPAARMEKG